MGCIVVRPWRLSGLGWRRIEPRASRWPVVILRRRRRRPSPAPLTGDLHLDTTTIDGGKHWVARCPRCRTAVGTNLARARW